MATNAGRIAAVDAFRGITIAAMILVNNPGSWGHVYAPMLHAHWHGWTPTDLIFPFFIFIVGIAAAFSIPRQLERGALPAQVMKKALVRSAKLFGLGLFLALFYYQFSNPDYNWWQARVEHIRILGVLQRIALVFALTVVLMLFLRARGLIVAALVLLGVYSLSMLYLPYADSAGNVYQGQWAFGNSFAAWMDDAVLGIRHVYYPKATPFVFDPEGLFSTLPAVATCLLGVVCGHWLASDATPLRKSGNLALAGVIGVGLGYALSPVIPINKALWTPSYVLLTAGLGALILALLIVLMDVRGNTRWAKPFIVCGANSIAFYMLAGVLARILMMIPLAGTSLQGWLYTQVYAPLFGELNGSLAYAITFLLVCYLPIAWMYRKGIFWKV